MGAFSILRSQNKPYIGSLAHFNFYHRMKIATNASNTGLGYLNALISASITN